MVAFHVKSTIHLRSTNSYLTNYGQNVQFWTFWVTMVTFTCVIL
jgi:hypothetical protein